MNKKIKKKESKWREQLTSEQYKITREKGTEQAFTGKYNNFKDEGVFVCVCCGNELFNSEAKYDSGSGWPSYWKPVSEDNVRKESDRSNLMVRTEVICNACDAHLGHVFEDGPESSGLRYCINSASLDFKKKK